jgi:hypothetical protein
MPAMARIDEHLDGVETRLAGLQDTLAECTAVVTPAAPPVGAHADAPPNPVAPHWQLQQHRTLVITGVILAAVVGTWPIWSGHRAADQPVDTARDPAPDEPDAGDSPAQDERDNETPVPAPVKHQFILGPMQTPSIAKVPALPVVQALIVQDQAPRPAPAEPQRSLASASTPPEEPPALFTAADSHEPVSPVLPDASCSPDSFSSALPVMAQGPDPDTGRLPVSIRRMRSATPAPHQPSVPSPRTDVAQLVQPAQL